MDILCIMYLYECIHSLEPRTTTTVNAMDSLHLMCKPQVLTVEAKLYIWVPLIHWLQPPWTHCTLHVAHRYLLWKPSCIYKCHPLATTTVNTMDSLHPLCNPQLLTAKANVCSKNGELCSYNVAGFHAAGNVKDMPLMHPDTAHLTGPMKLS